MEPNAIIGKRVKYATREGCFTGMAFGIDLNPPRIRTGPQVAIRPDNDPKGFTVWIPIANTEIIS